MKKKSVPVVRGRSKHAEAARQKRIQLLNGNLITLRPPILTPDETAHLRDCVETESGKAPVGQQLKIDERRTDIGFVDSEHHEWLYAKLWAVANDANKLYKFNLTGIEDGIQVAMYDAAEQGFYTWHADATVFNLDRKISISVPLNDPGDYTGGELQFLIGGRGVAANQVAGAPIIFPSFLMHRVTPVTEGKRYSVVAWILGPDWK